jgi:alpha-D-ribose 1-methylphosphonate 5-phosphate C-P lyase
MSTTFNHTAHRTPTGASHPTQTNQQTNTNHASTQRLQQRTTIIFTSNTTAELTDTRIQIFELPSVASVQLCDPSLTNSARCHALHDRTLAAVNRELMSTTLVTPTKSVIEY